MIIPPHAKLHYRTRLFLRPADADAAPGEPDADAGPSADAGPLAHAIREALRVWAIERFGRAQTGLEAGPFHEGRAHLVSVDPGGFVRTVAVRRGPPEGRLWAFHARVGDPAVRDRTWAHEVSVDPSGEEGVRLSVRVHHWVEVGEVGRRPPRPPPGPPAYLTALAGQPGVQVTDGRHPLPLAPLPVRPGDAPALVERLADRERRVALVYLSATYADGRPAIDPGRVADAVALSATVHAAASPELDQELDHFLSPDLRCYGGALRIYHPDFDPRAVGRGESERHRYIPRGRLASTSPDELLAEIVREALRAIPLEDPEHEPVGLDEVEALERRLELDELREEADALRERSRGGLSAEDARKLFRFNEGLEARLRSVEADNQRLATRAYRASERLEKELDDLPRPADAAPPPGELDPAALVAALRELPSTPAEALDLASHLFPHRLKVMERAVRSARDAPPDDAAMAWRFLVALAEVLHPLHFDGGAEGRSPIEIREAFGDQTRFDVAFTESKSTKASARLRELRTFAYEGEEVEFLWHVKWGSRPPKLLRAYYHPDARRRLLVIGWFGDHLETAGTRRM